MSLDTLLCICFGVLTAVVNAIALASQHIASSRVPSTGRGWRFVLDLLKQPLWLLGWLALLGSLVFQSLALHFGPVGLVQPLLISELIIALVIRRLWLHQQLRTITITSAILTTGLLVLFVTFASPSSGKSTTSGLKWLVTVATCSLVVAILVLVARGGSVRRKAGLLGMATAIMWALEAVLIKVFTDNVTSSGYLGTLAHWPIYAFVGCGVAGLFCEQAALHVGPLSVSQPFIVIVDPLISVILGVVLFAERWQGGSVRLAAGAVLLGAISVGAWILIKTGPETMAGSHQPVPKRSA
jgi:drug/metabolite transporter (DMT)-like permease